MNLKKITSLTMLLSMLIMTYTGIMLFISPQGKIAYWANWELLSLSKVQYTQLHSTMMLIFTAGAVLHTFYNWKPITSYMKNKSKEISFLSKDMGVAIGLTFVFTVGTLYSFSPFSNFLSFGDGVKKYWVKEYGKPPYSHAEASTLEKFTKKLKFDLNKSTQILNDNNIIFKKEQTLSVIAKVNNVSPKYIYDLLKKEFSKKNLNTKADITDKKVALNTK